MIFIKIFVLLSLATLSISSYAGNENEYFWGVHQGGITNGEQTQTYFISFDMVSNNREDLIKLLQSWTLTAAEITNGPEKLNSHLSPDEPSLESGAAVGLSPKGLTITFGFGPSLFEKNGEDRYGIAKNRPEALVDLPRFPGDQLNIERTGGDISIQVSANDPQFVEYAVRKFAKIANGVAEIKWAQTGFNGSFKKGDTPRNQMGFKDGTMNIDVTKPDLMNKFVWVGNEGPEWMRGGSYLVVRQIRISLAHWDDMKTSFQEETIGREKVSGAPIGKKGEFDMLELEAADEQGNVITNENSHAAMAAPETNNGAQILRRAFSYDNGVAKIAERWPPWKQLVTFDAGLFFEAFQRDPRTGFMKIFARMSQIDMLNQFTTHVAGGIYACPPGVTKGQFIGQQLFIN